jgi:hypothetical protein
MKVKKIRLNNALYYIGVLFIVVILVYILFKYTPLNSIFNVYEGLHFSYNNASVDIEPSTSAPQDIQDNFKKIDNINRNQTILVPSIAASIYTDSAPLLKQFLKIKQNIERTYPNSITVLTQEQSKDYKADNTKCPTSITDINDIYKKITNIVYALQGIRDITDIKNNANTVIIICRGTKDDGLQYDLKGVRDLMTAYIDKTKQYPISSNGQKIVDEFKKILGPINNYLYQVEDLFTYNSGDTNGFINAIKQSVKNYNDNNNRNLPPGAGFTRRGKCFTNKKCKL